MKMNRNDIEAFRIFTITPYASPEAMKEFVSENRLRTYKKEGLVKRIKYYDKASDKNKAAYCLTHQGHKRTRQELYLKTTYSSDRRTVCHDCKVSESYAMLSPFQRESAVSEHHFRSIAEEVMSKFLEQNEWERAQELQQALMENRFSAPDIIYRTENGSIGCLEIVTDYYCQAECQIKEDTSALIGAEYTQIHI